MSTVHPNVQKLALDLSKHYPRSPHSMLAGYVLAGRALDKCRADLTGQIGEYHYDCPLDNFFLGFAGLKGSDLREFVATGHFRNGILLAPATAYVIADLIEGKPPAFDLTPYSPNRFTRNSQLEAQNS